jgi:nucleotide-binding universal stress UspA family protein
MMSTTNHTTNGGPTIVVGWDGSAAARGAIAAAARIAPGGTVIAVHAHEEIAPHVTSRWQELLALDGAERSTELLREIPEAAIVGIERVHLEAASVVGEPAAALLRAARDHHADAIAVGSRGIGATSAESGSVSSELLRTADLPVLVIPPTAVHDRQEA